MSNLTQSAGDPLARPLLRALDLVVREGRKHSATGHEDAFTQVARICNAALLWRKADLDQNFDLAEHYLAMIPE